MKQLLIVVFASLLTVGACLGQIDEWEMLENSDGLFLEARILQVEDGKVSFIRKSDGRRFDLEVAKFSERSVARFKEWQTEKVENEQSINDDGFSKKLYPRTRSEIKDTIREIEGRKKPGGIDSDQHEAVTELNIFRYLCGVPFDVEADPEIVGNATEAAQACKEHGDLSHDLGSFTNKCNLSTVGDITSSPRQYINDGGGNNREARGHRRWCLNPPMEITGFGSAGSKYSAMWAMDKGGDRNRDPWAYPGMGYFPADRVHGNGWSLYLTSGAPSEDELTVEVYKLSKRPEKLIPWGDEVPGRALPVPYVATYQNAINFEPDDKPISGRGIYYVRVDGGGVREQYLVELY